MEVYKHEINTKQTLYIMETTIKGHALIFKLKDFNMMNLDINLKNNRLSWSYRQIQRHLKLI